MASHLDENALDQLFRKARTFNKFKPDLVSDETVHQLYDLLKWGPTAFNTLPARFVFVRSPEAKERLAPALASSNKVKTLAAPLTVIIAYDTRFYEHLPKLCAVPNAKTIFENAPDMVAPTALRNGSLQGAYLILAARALGLDVGPMSGFNPDVVNETFFPDRRYEVNFIANLGYGESTAVYPRAYRFEFNEVAQII